MLVRLERDATGSEASQFVAALAEKLVGLVDRDGILDEIRTAMAGDRLDEALLLNILAGHFRALCRYEDEEVLDWVIDYLMKGGD